MPLEIEAKMRVDSHAGVVEALREHAAEPVARLLETNTYLDTSDNALREADAGLRVRLEANLDSGRSKVVITHKGPKRPGKIKTRPETELEADGEADAIAMLGVLGYQPILRFQKRRDRWRLDGCLVELDRLALGSFVEIEGPSEQAVLAVREKLGLGDRELVSNSYIMLLVRAIEAGEISPGDLEISDADA